MIGKDSNHCRIVAECLAGQRDGDEQTLASLSVLDERLERLKKLGGVFSGVVFSRAAEQLRAKIGTVPVG